jgi:hypothetical protein
MRRDHPEMDKPRSMKRLFRVNAAGAGEVFAITALTIFALL